MKVKDVMLDCTDEGVLSFVSVWRGCPCAFAMEWVVVSLGRKVVKIFQ